MKYTLLDLTQTVASSLDADYVNSISDTVESQQIATIIRTVYFDLVARANLPSNFSSFSLIASGSSSKPTLMTVPTTVEQVLWVKYNKETSDDTDMNYQLLDALPIAQFMDRMHSLRESEDNIGTFSHIVDGNSTDFLYMDDRAPNYYTSLDDYTIIFDSYDSDVDTTLQGSKTQCYGKRVIPWTVSDTFTPDLNDEQFALLVNEAKAMAWAELRQVSHQKAELNARRGWSHLGKSKTAVPLQSDFDKLRNFGRK